MIAISSPIIIYLICLWFVWYILLVLYNISPFHKLSKFPGPKLAAASYLYEAYFDLWLGGRYGRKIHELHKIYGPVVRINPDELHCSDPQFADQLYGAPGSVRDKWQHHLNGFIPGSFSSSTFSSVPHNLHHIRRSSIVKFFSRHQMLKLEHEVLEFAQVFVDKILQSAGKPVEMRDAFNCYTADVISQYSFGEPMGYLSQDGWKSNFSNWSKPFFEATHILRYLAPARIMAYIIPWTAGLLGQETKALLKWMNVTVPGHVKAALKNPQSGRIFADIVASKILPAPEKSIQRLSGEGVLLLLAGSETTASVLTVLTYYLLSRPEHCQLLMQDLQGIDQANLKWVELERRPYLWATIHETLRLMPSVSMRSARVAPTENMHYRSQDGTSEWIIPKNTPVSIMSLIGNQNEQLYPNPEEYNPQRWLIDGQPNYKLSKSLLTFSKGSRSCVGENLAFCEIFIMTTMLALHVIPRAKLYDTTAEDIAYDHDSVVIFTKKGPLSVRITID